MTEKTYTTNWNARNLPMWETNFSHLKDKPTAYLEIGVWEARNVCWMMDNILLHPGSTTMGIDAWEKIAERPRGDPAEIEARALANVLEYGDRVYLIKGHSASVLSTCWAERPVPMFDLCFIDGSHDPMDILADSALTWRLIRPGGIVIWDEYRRRTLAKRTIDYFLAMIPDEWEKFFGGRQNLAVKKKRPDCPPAASAVV